VAKWASEQGRVMAEWKTDMGMIKEGLLELKEIKEMFKAFKKADKSSEGSENSVNGEERRERSAEIEKEERAKTWTRRVELPVFEVRRDGFQGLRKFFRCKKCLPRTN